MRDLLPAKLCGAVGILMMVVGERMDIHVTLGGTHLALHLLSVGHLGTVTQVKRHMCHTWLLMGSIRPHPPSLL